jgi:predicted P-loop ATPase
MTFAKHALRLFEMGYPVLPAHGKEVHALSWTTMNITRDDVVRWASNGEAQSNIGIRTGDDSIGGVALTMADIDVYDRDVARRIAASLEETFGTTIERRGMAPKRGLIYAMSDGFSKIQASWVGSDGVIHKVEWIAKFLQFIAYGIHPDTKLPYTWANDRSLLDVEPWELPAVTAEAVQSWMDNVLPTLLPSDWVRKTSGSGIAQPADSSERALLNFKPALDIDWEDVRQAVLALDADCDHDTWVKVMMAIHHQSQGGAEGLALAHEWSASAASGQYKKREVDAKWRSMKDDPARGAVVSMATVLKMAQESPAYIEAKKEEKIEALAAWLEKIDACTDTHDLQRLAEKRIAYADDIGDMDRVMLIDAMQRKAQDLTGVRPTKDVVVKWVKKRGNRPMPDVNSDGRPLETENNLKAICDNHNVTVRYNVIKKDDEILIPGAAWSVDNAKSASLTWLRGACHKEEVPTKYLKNFVTLLADMNQYNPVITWVTSKPWDGVSRLGEFYATIQENPEKCSKAIKETLMRKWAVSAIAAAFSPNGTAVRGVLTFQGAQYTGKTRWVNSLAPTDLELIKLAKSLNVHDKDSVKQILSCWIAELGELDSTFKRSDIAGLKAFITNDKDELRRPYAEAESQYVRRTVFVASVNNEQFLQDETGNTRFWVIPTNAVIHDHTIEVQQFWAEVHQLWVSGEIHYLTDKEMHALNAHNEEFSTPDPVSEMVASHLEWETFDPANCNWMRVSDVLRWIGMKTPTKWDTVAAGRTILKLNQGHSRRSNGQRLSAVPLHRKMVSWEHADEIGDFGQIRDIPVITSVLDGEELDPENIQF